MLRGTLLAESLRVGHDLRVADLKVTRIGRHDVSQSTVPPSDPAEQPDTGGGGSTKAQPGIWTFVEFEAPDERAGELADALAAALVAELGWYADFTVGDDRVVVFAGTDLPIPDRRRGRPPRGGRVRARRRHPATSGRLGRVTTSAPDATLRPLTCSNLPFWKVELRFPTWKVNRSARPPRKPQQR